MIEGQRAATDRGVIGMSGPDSRALLQGIVSNDINRLGTDRCLYAALLTPQGKYLFDFLLFDDGERLLIDCQAAQLSNLLKRLSMYRLRAKCEIEDLSESLRVYQALGEDLTGRYALAPERGAAKVVDGGVLGVDPRLAALGLRAIATQDHNPFAELETLEPAAFHTHRVSLGVAEGEPELVPQKSLLLESNFEELDGVDFKKGCFVGQELTARTKYRGLVKKRVMPIDFDGPAPEPDTVILDGDREVGEVRAVADAHGLALIRLERVDLTAPAVLRADQAKVRLRVPDWLTLTP